MARWVEIAARRPAQEKLAQVGPVSKRGKTEGRGNQGGIRKAARDLGVTRQTVERAVRIASLSLEANETGRDTPHAAQIAAAKGTEPSGQEATAEFHSIGDRQAKLDNEPQPARWRGPNIGMDPPLTLRHDAQGTCADLARCLFSPIATPRPNAARWTFALYATFSIVSLGLIEGDSGSASRYRRSG